MSGKLVIGSHLLRDNNKKIKGWMVQLTFTAEIVFSNMFKFFLLSIKKICLQTALFFFAIHLFIFLHFSFLLNTTLYLPRSH
jgi:hypothetical protein